MATGIKRVNDEVFLEDLIQQAAGQTENPNSSCRRRNMTLYAARGTVRSDAVS